MNPDEVQRITNILNASMSKMRDQFIARGFSKLPIGSLRFTVSEFRYLRYRHDFMEKDLNDFNCRFVKNPVVHMVEICGEMLMTIFGFDVESAEIFDASCDYVNDNSKGEMWIVPDNLVKTFDNEIYGYNFIFSPNIPVEKDS